MPIFVTKQVWLAVGSLMILATVAMALAPVLNTRNVMIPFVLAIFISTVVSPVVDFQVCACVSQRGWRLSPRDPTALALLALWAWS